VTNREDVCEWIKLFLQHPGGGSWCLKDEYLWLACRCGVEHKILLTSDELLDKLLEKLAMS